MQKVTPALNQAVAAVKPSVLCIDDSPGMLMICRAILEANGYAVLTASGAQAGIELLENNAVNAAVIDDGLAEMDAVTLAAALRKVSPELPIVVFMRSVAPAMRVAGTETCVAKGNGPKALLAAVNKICNRKH